MSVPCVMDDAAVHAPTSSPPTGVPALRGSPWQQTGGAVEVCAYAHIPYNSLLSCSPVCTHKCTHKHTHTLCIPSSCAHSPPPTQPNTSVLPSTPVCTFNGAQYLYGDRVKIGCNWWYDNLHTVHCVCVYLITFQCPHGLCV